MLFPDVPKVEIEICHQGLTGIAHGFDILDDCRAGQCQTTSVTFDGESKYCTNQRMVLPEPATQKKMLSGGVGQGLGEAHIFRGSRLVRKNLLISIPYKSFH